MSRRRKGFRAARVGATAERFAQVTSELEGKPFPSFSAIRGRMVELYSPIPHSDIKRLGEICAECGESGHWVRDCPQTRCYACGNRGHVQRNCPESQA